MQNVFLVLSTMFGILSPVLGIILVFQGKYKPQRVTKFIYTILLGISVFSLFALGDRNAIFLALIQLLNCSLLFALSFKYGMGGQSLLDKFILISCVVIIVVWQYTNNSLVALLLSILVDFLATVPTIIKAYKMPETEDYRYYLADVIAGFFSIASIGAWDFEKVVFPVYIFAINLALATIIRFAPRTAAPKRTPFIQP